MTKFNSRVRFLLSASLRRPWEDAYRGDQRHGLDYDQDFTGVLMEEFLQTRVLQLLQSGNRPFKSMELAEILNENEGTVSERLWDMAHSKQYREMAYRTDKLTRMNAPDRYGNRKGVCGDRVELFIGVQDETIQAVSFILDGCRVTNACAHPVAHLVEGRGVAEAWEITSERVVNYLGTLPPEKIHCAELVTGALYLALSNYRELTKSPWKKVYGSF